MAITELVTGGFGDLGQAAGAGLNEYTTQMDYDKLAQYVDSLFKQGVSPQQAVQLVNQRFPGAAQGGGSASPGVGSLPAAPRPNVPGINQPNVVPQTIGPSSQMQTPGGFGTLGAPQQAPQQAAPAPMGAQSARGPVDDSMLQTSPGRSPPQMQLAQENPPQAESYAQGRPQNRMQQTSAAPSQAPQQPSMAGVITPRNMPLAQLILQQRQAQAAQQTEVAKANATNDLRQLIEGMKEQGRNDRTVFNAGAKAALKEADINAAMQVAQLNNDTRVLGILSNFKAAMARIGQMAADRTQEGEQFRQKLAQNDQVLKAFTQRYGAAVNGYATLPSAETQRALEETDTMFKAWVETLYGVSVTPGKKTTKETPGSIIPPALPKTETTKTPPQVTVKPPKNSRAAELGIE